MLDMRQATCLTQFLTVTGMLCCIPLCRSEGRFGLWSSVRSTASLPRAKMARLSPTFAVTQGCFLQIHHAAGGSLLVKLARERPREHVFVNGGESCSERLGDEPIVAPFVTGLIAETLQKGYVEVHFHVFRDVFTTMPV